MGRLLKYVFNINSIHLIIPFLLFFIYGPGILIAIGRIGATKEALEFLQIFVCSIAIYFSSYFFIRNINRKKLVIDKGISIIKSAQIIFFIYSLFILYVVITAPKIPFLEALFGAQSGELSYYREMFFKARIGFDSILVYINALFTVAILPFLVSSLYIINYKRRHYYLLFFIFTLVLSMEKSLIARALLPLLVLVVNGLVVDRYLSLKNIFIILSIGFVSITFLSLGNLANGGSDTALLQDVIEIDPVAARYFIVSNPDNTILFILNRLFWIPYITAIDWLSYYNEVLHRELVMGASSSFISGLFGMERVNLERLVFEFEWGQNESGTGSSNTVYFIDIFLNFGWIGVIIANVLLALVVNFFEFCNNNAAKATFFVYAYFIVTSSLIAVFISSGLILFMFLILIFNNK